MKSTKMNFTQIYSADCFLSLNLVKRGPMPMQTLTGQWLDTKKIRTRYVSFSCKYRLGTSLAYRYTKCSRFGVLDLWVT